MNFQFFKWCFSPIFVIINAIWLLIIVCILVFKFDSSDSVLSTGVVEDTQMVKEESLAAFPFKEKRVNEAEKTYSSLDEWSEVLGNGDLSKRLDLFSSLLSEGRYQLPEVIQVLDTNNQDRFNQLLLQCGLTFWSRIDGENALSYALRRNMQRPRAITEVELILSEWLEVSSPAVVANFLQQLSREDIQKIDSNKLVALLKSVDIDLAISLNNLWAYSSNSRHSIEVLTEELIQQGRLDALIGWLDAVNVSAGKRSDVHDEESEEDDSRSSYRDQLIRHAIKEIAQKNLSLAKSWLEKEAYHNANAMPQKALQFVTREIAERDPVEAANWLLQLPDSEIRNNAFKIAIAQWTMRDSGEVATWINEQRNPQFPMDSVVSAYVDRIMDEAPASAMLWGESIQDEAIRKRTLLRVGSAWKNQDSQAFEAWLETEGVFPGLEGDFSNLLNQYTFYDEGEE